MVHGNSHEFVSKLKRLSNDFVLVQAGPCVYHQLTVPRMAGDLDDMRLLTTWDEKKPCLLGGSFGAWGYCQGPRDLKKFLDQLVSSWALKIIQIYVARLHSKSSYGFWSELAILHNSSKSRCIQRFVTLEEHTPQKTNITNIDTTNDGLENVSPFKHGYFG